MRRINVFFNLRNPSGSRVYSAYNSNEYQKHKNNCPDNVGSLTYHNQQASTACYGDSFTFTFIDIGDLQTHKIKKT
jgi:hypothetical protein